MQINHPQQHEETPKTAIFMIILQFLSNTAFAFLLPIGAVLSCFAFHAKDMNGIIFGLGIAFLSILNTGFYGIIKAIKNK